MKFEPWSLHIREDFPCRAMKRCKHAVNASDVKLDTNSKCTAFTDNEIDTHICLNYSGLANMAMFEVERSSIVHSDPIENRVRGDPS